MGKFKIHTKPYGDDAILIEWPSEMSKDILYDIKQFESNIIKYIPEVIVDVNSVYCSLLIIYGNKTSYSDLEEKLMELYNHNSEMNIFKKRIWEIPVCYDLNFGIDLKLLSSNIGVSVEEIISLHCSNNYMVYGIGFLPGFLYLGGLSKDLFFPRKKVPRLSVLEGAVGIGGNQTGIYPQSSPGGWNIIGNSPVKIFNKNQDPVVEISMGDEIQFKQITLDEYLEIKELVKKNNYELAFLKT